MDIPVEVGILRDRFGDRVIEYGFTKPRRIYVKIDRGIVRDVIGLLVSQGYTHISTITGLDTGRGLEVLYHLDRAGSLITVRVEVPYDDPRLPSITDMIPGAILYEGEVRDLFGVSFEGNPYPRPVILPDGWPEGLHPLRKMYKIDDIRRVIAERRIGAPQIEVEEGGGRIYIPVGPQHPALKEPIGLRFVVEGEYIVKVKARIGYNHRGIEKAMENQTYIQNLMLVERICGICSVAHTQCYVLAVESALNLEIPERARYIRVIMNELNRIHSHMLWMGVAGHEIGFDTVLMYTWRDREYVLDLLEAISGNRVTYSINVIGGVRRDITDDLRDRISKTMDYVEGRAKLYMDLLLRDPSFTRRTIGVGKASTSDALNLCAVGPIARAFNVKKDIRRDDPYEVYDDIPFEVIVVDNCDVAGTFIVRAMEIFESIGIIRYALEHMPSGEYRVKAPRRVPQVESIARVEAPRGELIHYLRGSGGEQPDRYKVRTPTLANIPFVAKMLEGCNVADIPIAFAAIDPCMACEDRMEFVDESRNIGWVWSLDDLRLYRRLRERGSVSKPIDYIDRFGGGIHVA